MGRFAKGIGELVGDDDDMDSILAMGSSWGPGEFLA
jgi:hypothetical protein